MANDKAPELDKGFEETPLDEGFHDVPLTAAQTPAPTSEPSRTESFLTGAAQGATLGFAPQIQAAGMTAANALMGGFSPAQAIQEAQAGQDKDFSPSQANHEKHQSLVDLYKEYLKTVRQQMKTAEAAHKVSMRIPFTQKHVEVGPSDVGAVLGTAAVLPEMGMLGPEAGLMARSAESAGQGAAMGALSGAAASDKPLAQMGPDIASGALSGTLMGAAAPSAFGLAKGVASNAAGAMQRGGQILGESLIGEGPAALGAGLRGQWLLGKTAQEGVNAEALGFGKNVSSTIRAEVNRLGKLKNDVISQAQERGIQIDPEAIDDFMTKHLGNDPMTNLDTTRAEMEKFREMLRTAEHGPEVERIAQKFLEQPQQIGQFGNLYKQKQAEYQQNQVEPGPVQPSEQGFGGYKKVAARPLDMADKEQIDSFENLFKQKQAEQRALPGGMDETPLELHYEPMPDDPDKVLGVIRQKMTPEDTQAFTGQPAQQLGPPEMLLHDVDVPGKKLGIIRQPKLDENNNVIGYKTLASKLLNEVDAEKFRNMTETVRAGGRNITNPKELYQLYEDLKQKSQFGDTKFKSDEARKAASDSMEDIQNLLRSDQAIPELNPIDAQISQYKQAAESIGMDTYNPDLTQPSENIAKMLDRSQKTSLQGTMSSANLQDMLDKLKVANPAMGAQLEQQANQLGQKVSTTSAVNQKLYLPRPLATAKALAAKSGNIIGYGINAMTGNWMAKTGADLLSNVTSKAAQSIGKVLSEAAEKDEHTRNAILFGLLQNPAYREILKPHLPAEQPKPEGSKGNTSGY